MNKYERSAELDRQMIITALGGGGPLRRFRLYHARGIPTYRGAIELAHKHGVERLPVPHIKQTTIFADDYWQKAYAVIVKVRRDQHVRIGAATDTDCYVAQERAWQNAVRQICLQEEMR